MRIIETVAEMQQMADNWRREGKRIAFVPTMGYLHEGHLELMRFARTLGNVVVISIFVNPTQFGPGEDYDKYPRDLQRDIKMAAGVGADLALVPQIRELYPDGFQTFVTVTEVSGNLCGRSRPLFFRGVATIVSKLFNIVKPHVAVFGEKDFQQLVVIRRMVKDLNMDVTVMGHPIVREPDGLAMSSRNTYLNAEERQVALRLSQSLKKAQSMVDLGEYRSKVIIDEVKNILTAGNGTQIDYVQLCNPETLEDVDQIKEPTLLALAVWIGKARLIDNRILHLN